jgi:hypothetical protein
MNSPGPVVVRSWFSNRCFIRMGTPSDSVADVHHLAE